MDRRLLTIVLSITILLFSSSIQPAGADSGTGQIGLVVQFGNGDVVTQCVNGDGISGYNVLQQSGLDVTASFSSLGVAVCKIGGDGCPEDNCFCQHPPHYWSYWQLSGGNWVYSPMGAAGRSVSAGSVEGWRWGEGDPPPAISFESICSPPPTAAPPPTAVPIPPTATSVPPTAVPPSATPIQATAVPTETATKSPSITTGDPKPVAASPTKEKTATRSVSPSPSPTFTFTQTAVTPSITPTVIILIEQSLEDEEGDSHSDVSEDTVPRSLEQQEQGSGGVPSQYLYFGIISVLMGAILVLFNLYQRKT